MKSIADLKNVENFKEGSLEHILEGQLNARGKAVGFHYEGMLTTKGKIISAFPIWGNLMKDRIEKFLKWAEDNGWNVKRHQNIDACLPNDIIKSITY